MDSWKIFIGRRDDISHFQEVTDGVRQQSSQRSQIIFAVSSLKEEKVVVRILWSNENFFGTVILENVKRCSLKMNKSGLSKAWAKLRADSSTNFYDFQTPQTAA